MLLHQPDLTAMQQRPTSWRAAFAVLLCMSLLGDTLATLSPRRTLPGRRGRAWGELVGPLPKSNVNLTIHIIPHTHDDVGWLKTVDEYFYGANSSIQFAGVQYILDSLIPALQADPLRKFTYVEIAFFQRWWREQGPGTRATVRQLVREGRLTFTHGGWCMEDEGTTWYGDIIDQMTLGHLFLLHELDVIPTIAWHIDDFNGHSSTTGALFAAMGFNAILFGRIDYQDRLKRTADQSLQLLWQPSASLGSTSRLFTQITKKEGYGPPPTFCWDFRCEGEGNPPIRDDPYLDGVNVAARAEQFVAYMRDQSTAFTTPHVFMLAGSDFNYQGAHAWYTNLDKLMAYVNAHPHTFGVTVRYSTPEDFFAAVHHENHTYPLKTDDFMPYANGPFHFFTGCYTSRPALKGYVRMNSNFLQQCRQLEASAAAQAAGAASSLPLWKAMSVVQHHDAVVGTEKQHVAFDYAKRIAAGHDICVSVMSAALSHHLQGPAVTFVDCARLNVSLCPPSQSGTNQVLVVYNGLAQPVLHFLSLPLADSTSPSQVGVVDAQGKCVQAMLTDSLSRPIRPHSASRHVSFIAPAPPVGWSTYFLTFDGTCSSSAREAAPAKRGTAWVPDSSPVSHGGPDNDTLVLQNEFVQVVIALDTGRITSVVDKVSGGVLPVEQELLYYNSSAGNNVQSNQASGAYIFRPNRTLPFAVGPGPAQVTWHIGSVVQEASIHFSDWATQVVRVVPGARHFEIEYTIGPIPIADHCGKEVITRWRTGIDSGDLFFTDSNGREFQQRRKDYRPTWKLNQTEPVAGNYFPINVGAYLETQGANSTHGARFAVLTDRSQGGASLQSGQLEVMLHRRTLYDDGRGVNEPLNETGLDGRGLIVRTKHYMVLHMGGGGESALDVIRAAADAITYPPTAFFTALTSTPKEWLELHHQVQHSLITALPANVHLLSLHILPATVTPEGGIGRGRALHSASPSVSLLLRLAHTFAVHESQRYSRNVTVNVSAVLLPSFRVLSYQERSLSGNQDAAQLHRWKWRSVQDGERQQVEMPAPVRTGSTDLLVNLKPMQIRTFVLELQHVSSDILS